MDSNLIIGLLVFFGREAWTSFWGARAKTLAAIEACDKKINLLQLDLTKALVEISVLRNAIDRLEGLERKYRR